MVIETEASGIKRASGQSCIWKIISSLKKENYYNVEIKITFETIINMDIYVISGYTRSKAYTVASKFA